MATRHCSAGGDQDYRKCSSGKHICRTLSEVETSADIVNMYMYIHVHTHIYTMNLFRGNDLSHGGDRCRVNQGPWTTFVLWDIAH